MVLWTIIPSELIFQDQNVAASPVYEEVNLAGKKVIVERCSPNQSKIVKLISTCPDDYLLAEFQPGTMLTYKPAYEQSIG